MRSWIVCLRELVLTSPYGSLLSGKADVELCVPGQDFSTGFRMSGQQAGLWPEGPPNAWMKRALLWDDDTHTNRPSFTQVLEETTLSFAQGKMLVDVGRQSTARVKLLPITHPYSTWDQLSINPHLLPSLSSPWHFPALLPESLQDHLMPFLLQPPLSWLLLLCPINQPVYFYLVTLWQEVGSMAHWRVPLVSSLFFFVFLYCLFNGALGAHWMLRLSCTERHD